MGKRLPVQIISINYSNWKAMIRIAMVEDSLEISSGINYIISTSEGFSCKVFPNAEVAVRSISPRSFDIVLMDIQLPGMSSIDCTQLLKEKYPDLKIMMCTIFEDEEKSFRAIAAGASEYILKRSDPQMLIQSIKELVAGGSPISGPVAQKILTAFRKMIPDNKNDGILSERERDVLNLIATGFRNKEVAEKLGISLATVKSHIYNIYNKLHVTSRVEAINKFKDQPKG